VFSSRFWFLRSFVEASEMFDSLIFQTFDQKRTLDLPVIRFAVLEIGGSLATALLLSWKNSKIPGEVRKYFRIVASGNTPVGIGRRQIRRRVDLVARAFL
jgi:hypothetical protein